MQTLDEIKMLLHRNKLRLHQELIQSKEAMHLIKKATHTQLTEEERLKIKIQLLDICKVIPAFTVFMLPGGALLLPLLIKLIPDILPSAFRDAPKER
ncbi:LETM1 domain-containing protein [uncultured Polaribacter sp.]|uniref:LETM1 domain-containing protein n=1 Tax=uncultured Polaribacter sp. TaxID=174711 RepID=UPI002616DA6D|nr:LETM1 domain-containing protein [uncultured Polaribacter sp.]